MIDIEKAKKAFNEYVKKYDPNDPQIYLKIKHIETVVSVAKEVAESLNLDEENVKLAELIALLHDIGRFEQVKRYHTFMDKDSINHAEFGTNLLKEGLIREFIEDEKYDEIIRKSIYSHNKYSIDEELSEKELMHAKIIRDADKLDIMYQATCQMWNDMKVDIEEQNITTVVLEQFLAKKTIEKKYIKNDTILL